MSTWNFNPNQLATWADAKDLAARIEGFRQSTGVNMGGGVLPVTADPNTSGIYVPSWDGGPGGFPEPADPNTGLYFLHFRCVNGRSGVNVGLILDKIKRYGGNETYVFYYLNAGDLS